VGLCEKTALGEVRVRLVLEVADEGMEEREWQIMLEQFIASGIDVNNEIINIDSD
jgi:hypothetical protein